MIMSRSTNKDHSEFIESMLKSAKEKGSPKPKPLHESVDMKEVENIVKNLEVKKTRRKF